jgi:nitrite reductase (cytochrome c-552)
MQLRVTRPGFLEGIRVVKASQGQADYDVNRDATRQEMRTYVCGQCHVEYYFAGAEKRLTYPWAKGLRADEILSYYEENGFRDWVHAESGAPTLKAQHPEFEMYNQGVHARSGVACADCHMPYQRTGAMKVTDHHVQSPLLNVNRACQTCHRWPEEELRERVHTIQDRTFQVRNIAMDALLALIADIKTARDAGADDAALAQARNHQRRAQFLLDFIEAENSMGFHADQEAMRVLALSLDESRRGQASLPGSRATAGARTQLQPTVREVSPGTPPPAQP